MSPDPKRVALLVAVLVAAPGCFLLPYQGGTPERPVVTSFDVEGTKAISVKDLKEHLATQASSHPFPSFLPKAQFFDPDAFANDQRRMIRYYQAHGYYRAKIEAAEVIPDGSDAVKLRVQLSEGPPTRVASVDVEGLDAAPEAKAALGKKPPLMKGDIFTEAAYDAMRAAILAALANTGWPKAEVTQHAAVDPALDQARVTYLVKPGERYRFGSVFVAGASSVPRGRIREEAQSAVRPGATFDASELDTAQRRVFDLGVFGGVRVTPGPADDRNATVPVVVSVREAPFRTIRAGPGFSFQAIRWQADVSAGWTHRNWLGGLRKLNLDARAGYAWLPTLFNVQKQGFVGLATADFTQPHVLTRYVDFNIRLELERGLEQAYSFVSERARFGFPFRFGRLVTFSPSVNFELYQLSNPVSGFGGGAQNTASTLQLATCPGQNPSLCLLSFLEQRLYVDLRDDPINTTSGLYFGISVQEGFRMFGNGAGYLRLLPEARAFANFGAGFVGAFRARVGIIHPIGATTDLPLIALFTSGGPSQMRGYYTRQLSPVVEVCPAGKSAPNPAEFPNGCTVYPDFVPIGGAGLVDGSFELRFPITGALGGAAFLDFGNVRSRVVDAFRFEDLQYAVGLGLRYRTVLGPIRVDVAYRLPKPGVGEPGVEVFRLCPVVDPTRSPRPDCLATAPSPLPPGTRAALTPLGHDHSPPFISVHLSIGEAF